MLRQFGEKLRMLRLDRGVTQVDLAQHLGLSSHAHITNLEAGRRAASLSLIVQVAAFFGVSSDYLLRDDLLPASAIDHQVSWPTLPSPPLSQFGQRLRKARQEQDLSQTALAQKLARCSQAHLSLLENGRSEPSPELVVELAAILGISTDELLREGVG